MKAWPALISGELFGLGLTLSGMSDPAKVLGFLNITGAWIPELIFVLGGAVVTFLVTPVVTAREAPLLASPFSLPGKQISDRRLVGGAVLFGIGWGLSGYCPGLALVSLPCDYESTVVFCLAMFAGMALEGPISRLLASS